MLDLNTGLPLLPANQFWRIEENQISIMEQQPEGEWAECAWYEYRNYKASPSKYDVKTETSVVTTNRRRYYRSKDITEVKYFYRTKPTESLVHTKMFGGWIHHFAYSDCQEPDPVTHGNVVERCQAIINEMESENKRKALYGDYPPKTILEV